jgi:predicted DNA-binding transcriptional regulator AlpA
MQPLLAQKQCAEMLGLSERTLERLRVTGTGPKFLRIRHSIRYRPEDIQEWAASRIVRSTSEEIGNGRY